MTDTLEVDNTRYTFRFTDSNQCICLNKQQLDCIPYLSVLVSHKDDFLSNQNETDEYLLHPPIHYTWFIAVQHSISSEQPYTLFTELPEHENILGAIQLIDYLGCTSFPLPLLKETDLIFSNSATDEKLVTYHRANLVETRNTTAEFVIALSKNAYNLHDYKTVNEIISLIKIILTNPTVYSSRFRHHTLTVAKECCWMYFSKVQQLQLYTTHQNIQKQRKLNSLMYLYDDNNPLSDDFSNVFVWKGTSIALKVNNIHPVNDVWIMRSTENYTAKQCILRGLLRELSSDRFTTSYRTNDTPTEIKLEKTEKEGFLARSRRFNVIPQRPTYDKFNHRFCSKTKKYR
ncbi:unnamed protein product [Adineta steineri]|uniref:Uncharacterized protein n=1 Tax=Adineta steineri TaxID=433720 RepID=A0A814FXV5_9BILA|nr:unnamed protein product [Adineta steineri]CAF0989430.1 unnamed protein product [Adineta steineri]